MISIYLIAIPLIMGLVSFLVRGDYSRRCLLIVSALAHFVLTCEVYIKRPRGYLESWFGLDSLGILFLGITSLLFFAAAVYGVKYLSVQKQHMGWQPQDGSFFCDAPEAVFTGCLLLFFSMMTAIIVSRHLGVLWVAMEATTLASAPLIYFHRARRSLEATWKYLLICSVGIALGLFGIFFLAVANAGHGGVLTLSGLLAGAGDMNMPWLKAAFLFIFVGYGTKMGLAPFHTWLPDAHSEAPSVVSALLSGALLNCAFLGILRVYQVCIAAGLMPYCQEIFVVFGLLSIVFAAFFILEQLDYKRMLAYSSIEHMGILALGVGLGGGAVFGAMLNAVSHSLTKAGLFFVAGNILSFYRTKYIADVRGIFKGKIYRSGILWLAGFLLITGTPPGGVFFGKFIILKECIFQKNYWATFIFLMALAVIFIGMARIFISMTQGTMAEKIESESRRFDSFWEIVPSAVFFVLVAAMGVYLPVCFVRVLNDAARALGGA